MRKKMSLRISGKHMNVGEALSQRIEDRVSDAVSKYFHGGYTGHVTLEKSGNRFKCDCMIHLDSGAVFQASSDELDPTVAFETSADRIEKRLRRYKRRLKDHHSHASKKQDDAAYTVMAAPADEEEMPEDYNPAVIAESSTSIRIQSVADAVMQLDMTDQPVIVFTNAVNNRTNVVYRRSDGNIGWVDPSRAT